MMMGVVILLRRLADDRRGAALVELGFAVPVLGLILLGCFEATRYVLLHQKLDRAAASSADLVAQLDGITTAQICDLFDAASQLMDPYDLTTRGRVVVSSVYRPGVAEATVAWQQQSTGTLAVTSQVGASGATAALPAGLTVQTGQNVIVAEAFYDYHPYFLGDLFGASHLYHTAYNRPRISNLTVITGAGC